MRSTPNNKKNHPWHCRGYPVRQKRSQQIVTLFSRNFCEKSHFLVGTFAKKGLLPLSAYEDFSAFKVYLSDIGLLGAMAELPAEALLQSSTFFTDFKGALTEQFVFEQLRLDSTNRIFYWSQEQSQGEIDFLVQRESIIIPIEVKAAENLRAKSLRLFVSSYEGLHGVRFSLSPYREQEWMTNYPLYTAETALKKKQE